ncbi:MAG TPA: transposase [Nitrososphaera sp.]|nr:transposase [Nitrososphaera sp.]
MNEGGEGAKYRYPSSLISLLATVHAYLLLPYRQLEGFLRVMSEHVEQLRMVPDYTTIWWRVTRVKKGSSPEPEDKSRKRRRNNSGC